MLFIYVAIVTCACVNALPNQQSSSECYTINHNYGPEQKGHQGTAIGLQGLPGKRGPSGHKGHQGTRGEMGLPGPTGPKGIKGEMGTRGSSGNKGSVGEKGKIGSQGFKGEIGPNGNKGEKGEIGIGVRGEKGEVPTSEINELRTEYEKLLLLLNVLQPPKTCAHLQDIAHESGQYLISPTEPTIEKPFYVNCKFTTTEAYTVFGHDSEGEIEIPSELECEPNKCYARVINYHHNMNQMRRVIQQSRNCRQYIKYRSQGSVLHWKESNHSSPVASWTNYNGEERHNWGGAVADYTCPCGEAGNCMKADKNCNSDVNDDNTIAIDEGYLNDKNHLPVTKMNFGDLAGTNEHGWHTLGQLECFGTI